MVAFVCVCVFVCWVFCLCASIRVFADCECIDRLSSQVVGSVGVGVPECVCVCVCEVSQVLDNLDFLGASFLSYSHEHMAPLVAAAKVTASTATTTAVDVSVTQHAPRSTLSAMHPRHVACARHRGCTGLGQVRHRAATAATAQHATPSLSLGAALETIGASPVFMASSPDLGALLQAPLNSPPQLSSFGNASVSPAIGALSSIGASPVLGAQSASGSVGSPAFGASALDWLLDFL